MEGFFLSADRLLDGTLLALFPFMIPEIGALILLLGGIVLAGALLLDQEESDW